MKLEIRAVQGQVDAPNEYLMLLALDDCDLSSYAGADNTYDASGSASNKVRHTFFFPSKQVKKGEWVALYTKSGKYNLGKTTSEKPLHCFYWGLTNAVWNDSRDIAHLLEISGVKKLKVPPKA